MELVMLSVKVFGCAAIASCLALGCGAAPSTTPQAAQARSESRSAPGAQPATESSVANTTTTQTETTTAPAATTQNGEGTKAEGTASGQPSPQSAGTVPPLPEGTTILHVGDSFAGALGIDLNLELKKVGIKGVLRFQTSSYIPTWAWGKELDLYILQSKPDLVLITLGANELEVPDPQQRVPAIEKLVHRVGDRPCVWIAPPLWEGARRALLDVIRDHCAPCVYMESSDVVPNLPRARDKIHPSMEARKTWARVVLDWLARHRDPKGPEPWALRNDAASAAASN